MTALGFLLGAGFGAGLWLLWDTWASREPRPDSKWRLKLEPHQVTIGAGAAWLTYIFTGWPVAALLAFGFGAAAPRLFSGRRAAQAAIAKTEAVASWTETLRDTLAGSAGLQRTIVVTARVAPDAIAAEVAALAERLERREPLAVALRRFAEEVSDATADLVVSALILASERRAGNLTEMLSALAHSAREEANMQRRVLTSRARTRTAVMIITIATLAMTGGLILLNRPFLEPYDGPGGQLMLLVIGALFGFAFWRLHRLGQLPTAERFLRGPRVPRP